MKHPEIARDLRSLRDSAKVAAEVHAFLVRETRCRRREGEPLPIELHLGVVELPHQMLVVTLRDATELVEGREATFEAEAKYRALVEQIPAVVYLDPVDEGSDSIYVSPQVTTLLGISQAEWLADPYCWRLHVHPDDIDRVWEAIAPHS